MTTPVHAQPRLAPAYVPSASARRTKRTLRFVRPHGPLVVDIWEPEHPEEHIPLLLIHGWGGTGSYWRQTAQALSATTSVIVPDLPGTGRSQPVKRTQNMFDQVATLAALLDEFRLEQVQIVGHSMGGGMAVLLAAQQPERVRRLVLTSLTFFMTQAQKDTYDRMMSVFGVMMRFRPGWLAAVPGITQMMAQQYFYRVPADPATLDEGLRAYLALDRATALACAYDATSERIPQAGATLHMPTLLVAARQDQMMPPENIAYTLSVLPNCQVRWIEECGHLPMVEKPATYLAILQSFLEL